MCKIFVFYSVAIAFILGACLVSSQTTLSPQDLAVRCAYLNTVRANFTACCQYPVIVLWRWQMNQCNDNCSRLGFNDNTNCCPLVCDYRAINVVAPADNIASNFTHDPSDGLITAFMLSVGNDTQWTDTITDSINYCVSSVLQHAEFDSCGIPVHLYDIINCAYNEVFYRCALWNPSGLPECDFTREYVDLCYRVKVGE